jgi:phospholipid/cholesterol/gamma-HCH transport system permease protein
MIRLPKALATQTGSHALFFVEIWRSLWRDPFESREFWDQFAEVGRRSASTVLAAGLFTGGIMAVQFRMQLQDFGAESVLGGMSTSGTLREVGPILIAFMLAGKVGAFTSAELATMKVTDQIEALRCLGINPISFLVVPRFLAVLLSSILLLSFGLVISVIGGLVVAWSSSGMAPEQYLLLIGHFANAPALTLAFSKACVFGALMGQICCANGYQASGGTQGVGRAVRDTAMQSMVAIVIADFAITLFVTAAFRAFGWEHP